MFIIDLYQKIVRSTMSTVKIKDSDPKYAKYNSDKPARAAIMRTYYLNNQEAIKAKRRQRYQEQKDSISRAATEALITG